MVDIHITVTGPVHIHEGTNAEQTRLIVASELSAALTTFGDQIMSQFTDLRDAFAAFVADVTAKLDALQASVDDANSESHLTAEDQAALDELQTSLAAAKAAVGDANEDGV